MKQQLKAWKIAVEGFWCAEAPDFEAAARLVAGIAGDAKAPELRLAAAQALPGLRAAMLDGADQRTRDAAHRRLGPVRDILHVLTAPSFGRRGLELQPLTAEQRYRQLLGLPLDVRLSGPEIRLAYLQAAKTAHPDAGGSAQAFQQLSAARDALLKPR